MAITKLKLSYGRLMKYHRNNSDLTLDQAATKLGVSVAGLSHVECERRGPFDEQKTRLAARLFEVLATPLLMARSIYIEAKVLARKLQTLLQDNPDINNAVNAFMQTIIDWGKQNARQRNLAKH